MNNTITTSDSLVGSLSREAMSISYRYHSIYNEISATRDKILINRLLKEKQIIKHRMIELCKIASQIVKTKSEDDLSIIFLDELCKRFPSLKG